MKTFRYHKGTRTGGLRAKKTNMKKYGKNFYSEIGRKGGLAGHTGGFYGDPERARLAGKKGGRRSRRGMEFLYEEGGIMWYDRDGEKIGIDKNGDEV